MSHAPRYGAIRLRRARAGSARNRCAANILTLPKNNGETAGHRVGVRIKALAHVLHFEPGVPVSQTPAIAEELTGMRLTQGAITRDAMKQADGTVGALVRDAYRRNGFGGPG